MVQTLAAENVTLEQLILLYGLELVDSEEFFREWQHDLLELTSLEKQLWVNSLAMPKSINTASELPEPFYWCQKLSFFSKSN